MQCPKERTVTLIHRTLADQLAVQHCPACEGHWIPAESYGAWQADHPAPQNVIPILEQMQKTDYTPSEWDTKAGMCPDCGSYLVRAKVNVKTPFYVERCPRCKGMWCDRGEWDLLATLQLHVMLDRLFLSEWQTQARDYELNAYERRAMIEKLGLELAQRIFDLAEVLETHPHGDYGVAYLMRRFEDV